MNYTFAKRNSTKLNDSIELKKNATNHFKSLNVCYNLNWTVGKNLQLKFTKNLTEKNKNLTKIASSSNYRLYEVKVASAEKIVTKILLKSLDFLHLIKYEKNEAKLLHRLSMRYIEIEFRNTICLRS